MAKKPKKRNKKYNPHKVVVKTVEYVSTLEESCGFNPVYLKEWVDRSNEGIQPVEVADGDVFDVRPFAEKLHYRQTGWREPEYLVYSKDPYGYRNVLLDNCLMYARMLHVILQVDLETIKAWRTDYEQRIMNAFRRAQ